MSTWFFYWQQRGSRAEWLARQMAQCTRRCLDNHGCTQVPEPLVGEWLRPRGQHATTTSEWAERCGRAEAVVDSFLDRILLCVRNHYLTNSERFEAERLISERFRMRALADRPLPAGPTLEGNLKSGGIQ